MPMVSVDISQGIATITFNNPRILNAIEREGDQKCLFSFVVRPERPFRLDYNAFANALREIDKRSDVLVTIWQGTLILSTNSATLIASSTSN